MTRASTSTVASLCAIVVALVGDGCTKAVGSEGGPCTGGGACDPGLTCASNLCVRVGDGEGEGANEGEGSAGCSGDDGGAHSDSDCASMPTAACGSADQNEALTTCHDAALTLRAGIFDAVFPCLNAIPESSCASLDGPIGACFDAITACPNDGAQSTCQQASDTCAQENDAGFDLSSCISDLTPTNLSFRLAWADCFNAGGACATVESDCYNAATNQLVGGGQ